MSASQLHSVFYNRVDGKHDHCAVVAVRDWEAPESFSISFELAEAKLFPVGELPDDIARGTADRLKEVLGGAAVPHNGRW